VPAPVARTFITGLEHDFIANDAELRRLVPQRLLNFEESVRVVFDAKDRGDVRARWIEGAHPVRDLGREYAFFDKRADGTAVTAASPDAVWSVVRRIGGKNRYYGADILWWLRERLDWMIGGWGRYLGRRDPENLRVGDYIDSWTVLDVEPRRRLTLTMGLKAPGVGVLEFDLEAMETGGTRLTATAYWDPAGLGGLLYWYSLVPAHLFIFDRMTGNICRLAEQQEQPVPG
jgi:hypothetical protein